MKIETLVLAAPDFATLDLVARRKEPSVLWPVGGQSLAAHWLDHAVRLGCKRVVIHAADRPAEVRAALGGGGYWSLELEVSSQRAPADAIPMFGLPNDPKPVAPTTPLELLGWWFDLNCRWLAGRNINAVSIDQCREAGGWIGPRVKISASAKLVSPYWIGAGAEIGPECRIGPNAFIGSGSVLESDVHVENSFVLARTFLGSHIDVRTKIIDGNTLLDLVAGTRVELRDNFVASALTSGAGRVDWRERVLAAILWVPAILLALGCGRPVTDMVRLPGGALLALSTRSRGPLLARRASWLRHVIAGHMRLVGVLPRAIVPNLPPDSRSLLEESTPGMFALSDLHGIHTTADTEESVHAVYQAAVPAANAEVWRNLFRLCRLRPATSNA